MSSLTYLQLCQSLRQEASGSGTGPDSVIDQIGDMKRIVDWVADSYKEVQMAKRGWRWLFAEVVIPITAGQRDYTLAQIAVLVPTFLRFAHWKKNGFKYYVTSEGVAGERKLNDRLFEAAYESDYGTTPTGVRPTSVSVMPDGTLRLSHTPTVNGVMTANFYRTPQMLVADADEPEMPWHFQKLIVWHALTDFGIVEAASDIYERSLLKKDKLFHELMNDQLEDVDLYSSTLVQ